MARVISGSTNFALAYLNTNNGTSTAVDSSNGNNNNITQFESVQISPWGIDEGNKLLLKSGDLQSSVELVNIETGNVDYKIDFSNYTSIIGTMEINSNMVCCIDKGSIDSQYNDNGWGDCQSGGGGNSSTHKEIIIIALSAVSGVVVCIFCSSILFCVYRRQRNMKTRVNSYINEPTDNDVTKSVNVKSSLISK